MIWTTLGGIGIFLLGMVLMTDGLRSAAGEALRGILTRFTGGPFKAVLSGAAMTALVQSSSATTLATIGFVSAGLLTFTQAVGVIFGANLGTTSTGWIVSLIGLKLDVTAIALPLVGVGALMRLVGKGRAAAIGLAIAGFGLIFVGIDILQQGMEGLAGRIDLAGITGETIFARLALVAVGAVMTIVTQSSSAALATTLTAVHSGAIGLFPAAALVIGQNVGTTVTAGLASIGASIPARRTALAHVLFNLITAIVAFALLPFLLRVVMATGAEDSATTLAGFHTIFNLAGVVILLPVIGRFASLVTRLVPERETSLTRHLDPSVANVGPVAVETARRTVEEIAAVVANALGRLTTEPGGPRVRSALEEAKEALEETRRFLSQVRSSPAAPSEHGRHLAVLHAVDHLERLIEAGLEESAAGVVRREGSLEDAREIMEAVIDFDPALLQADGERVAEIARASAEIERMRLDHRRMTLEKTALGEISPLAASQRLDGMRWIERIVYHSWRAAHHLAYPSGADHGSEVYKDPESDSSPD
ncbi:MAG: Na/Pi cotransporter family protein [Thermoanaerobaculia bacterium]